MPKPKTEAKKYEIVGPPDCPADWGINYRHKDDLSRPEKRVEVGEIVTDLPPAFRDHLLADGRIREA